MRLMSLWLSDLDFKEPQHANFDVSQFSFGTPLKGISSD